MGGTASPSLSSGHLVLPWTTKQRFLVPTYICEKHACAGRDLEGQCLSRNRTYDGSRGSRYDATDHRNEERLAGKRAEVQPPRTGGFGFDSLQAAAGIYYYFICLH